MKACLITDTTIDTLAGRWLIEKEDRADLLPMGYWLVTPFGDSPDFDVVTEEVLLERYRKGRTLQHGFIALSENGTLSTSLD